MEMNQHIELSALDPDTTVANIQTNCDAAMQYHFAAVCVPPLFVKKAKEILKNNPVKVATVIGFPFGYSAVEAKIAETVLAIIDAVDELNVVINISAIKNNDWQYLANEINHILPIVNNKNKILKINIEAGLLTDDEIIKCCDLYGIAGVHFIETATGFASSAPSLHQIQLIRKHLADAIQIKAGAGLINYTFAMQLIAAGVNRIGTTNGIRILEEMNQLN